MRDGTTSVSGRSSNRSRYMSDRSSVHAEPGEDKLNFANDVADWVLARIPNRDSEGKAGDVVTSTTETEDDRGVDYKARL